MLLGALAFFYPLSLKMSHARAIQFIGVTLIIATHIFIGHDIAWPSYWALIPTVGTLLVLLANYEHSVLNKSVLVQIALVALYVCLTRF